MNKITFNNTDVPNIGGSRKIGEVFGEEFDKKIIPTFSGKSSLALLLAYFRRTGQLPNKSAQVLVPPWMGYWVYMIMHKYCFPSTTMNNEVRGVLLYHQWGFPQRIEDVLRFAKKQKLFVIEDCAHAFEGYHAGKRLGMFGDAAIFSLAKFFPCIVGGAIYTNNDDINRFIAHIIPAKESALEKEAFRIRSLYDTDPSERNHLALEQTYAIYDKLLRCDPRALRIASQEVSKGALSKRKANALRLKEEFMPHDTFGLFSCDIAPWVMPLFFEKEKAQRIVKALTMHGIESGIFQFDVNRNMLSPNYRECVAVPCHDGISEEQIDFMVKIIYKQLS